MTTSSRIRRHALAALCVLVCATAAPAPAAADQSAHRVRDREVRIIDLGVTPPDVSSEATYISDNGVVFGRRSISVGPFTVAQAWRWDDGAVTHLEGTGHGSWVTAVSERGDAAGYYVVDLEGSGNRAVLWRRDGTIVPLGPADVPSLASDVNRRGVVVGVSQSSPEEFSSHAAMWQPDGTLALLDDGGSGSSRANAINDRGQVVGYRGGGSGIQAVRWDRGRPNDFPLPHPEAQSQAWDINRRGQVLVSASWTEDGVQERHWYIWDGAHVEEIPGEFINRHLTERGEIVGTMYPTEEGSFPRAVMVDDGVVTDLGTLGLDAHVTAVGERGQAVGYSTPDDGIFPVLPHAVLFEDGETIDLSTLGGPSSAAFDVNRRGQVVGTATADESSSSRAVMWDVGR